MSRNRQNHATFAMRGALLLVVGSATALQVAPMPGRSAQRFSGVYMQQLPTGWKEVADKDGKPYFYNAVTGITQWQRPTEESFSKSSSGASRSLSPDSLWRVQLDLTAPTSASTKRITGTVRFAEEEGYEPPQGFMRVESCDPEATLLDGQQPARWRLSEDPEDRKDSLWIWGLFSDPLYPFILFELELTAPLEISEGVTIPEGTLYCQVDHRRKDGVVQLGEGAVTYKVTEKVCIAATRSASPQRLCTLRACPDVAYLSRGLPAVCADRGRPIWRLLARVRRAGCMRNHPIPRHRQRHQEVADLSHF